MSLKIDRPFYWGLAKKSFPGLVCGCGNDQPDEYPELWIMSQSRARAVLNDVSDMPTDWLSVQWCPRCISWIDLMHRDFERFNDPEVLRKHRDKIWNARHSLRKARRRKQAKRRAKEEIDRLCRSKDAKEQNLGWYLSDEYRADPERFIRKHSHEISAEEIREIQRKIREGEDE